MKVLSLLTASFFVLLLTACNKEPPPVPPRPDPCPWPEVTTQGLNTFGCKINGKEWVPCVDFFGLAVGLRPIDARLSESDGSNFLGLSASYSTESDTSNLFFLGLKPLKEGYIMPSTLAYARLKFTLSFNEGLSSKTWSLEELSQIMSLEILRLDTSENIIAGKIGCLLISEDGSDTLRITDGRFDINYYPQ